MPSWWPSLFCPNPELNGVPMLSVVGTFNCFLTPFMGKAEEVLMISLLGSSDAANRKAISRSLLVDLRSFSAFGLYWN